MNGTLYLCATPIGNLEDMTLRAIRLLKECDYIAAEDTRHTLGLLNHFQISTPLLSYHEHNKNKKGPLLIEMLKKGADIALVTDAGMPGISDPGEDLVRLCHENQIPVTCAPGPVAFSTAAVLSGLSTRRILFEGFLPPEKKERREVLETLKNLPHTLIFYEAPHRLTETLQLFYSFFGDRNAACIKEMTKKFEEVKKGTLLTLLEEYTYTPPKGEFVLVIEGVSFQQRKEEEQKEWDKMPLTEHMNLYLKKGMAEKDAMKAVAKDRGLSKRDIYNALKK